MTSDLMTKIRKKSKQFLLSANRDYHRNSGAVMPYEEVVVLCNKYPDFIFLLHKNMIFERNSIADSSYDVFCFDKEGNYIGKEDILELGNDFFHNLQEVKKL